jgi:hypothetical protein
MPSTPRESSFLTSLEAIGTHLGRIPSKKQPTWEIRAITRSSSLKSISKSTKTNVLDISDNAGFLERRQSLKQERQSQKQQRRSSILKSLAMFDLDENDEDYFQNPEPRGKDLRRGNVTKHQLEADVPGMQPTAHQLLEESKYGSDYDSGMVPEEKQRRRYTRRCSVTKYSLDAAPGEMQPTDVRKLEVRTPLPPPPNNSFRSERRLNMQAAAPTTTTCSSFPPRRASTRTATASHPPLGDDIFSGNLDSSGHSRSYPLSGEDMYSGDLDDSGHGNRTILLPGDDLYSENLDDSGHGSHLKSKRLLRKKKENADSSSKNPLSNKSTASTGRRCARTYSTDSMESLDSDSEFACENAAPPLPATRKPKGPPRHDEDYKPENNFQNPEPHSIHLRRGGGTKHQLGADVTQFLEESDYGSDYDSGLAHDEKQRRRDTRRRSVTKSSVDAAPDSGHGNRTIPLPGDDLYSENLDDSGHGSHLKSKRLLRKKKENADSLSKNSLSKNSTASSTGRRSARAYSTDSMESLDSDSEFACENAAPPIPVTRKLPPTSAPPPAKSPAKPKKEKNTTRGSSKRKTKTNIDDFPQESSSCSEDVLESTKPKFRIPKRVPSITKARRKKKPPGTRTTSSTTAATACSSPVKNGCLKNDDAKPSACPKKVRFGHLVITEFPIILGDNPAVSAGAPVTIDWTPQNESSFSIMAYEECKPKRRRRRRKLLISVSNRTLLLLVAGYSIDEIGNASTNAQDIKFGRQESIENQNWDRVNMFIENTNDTLREMVTTPGKKLKAMIVKPIKNSKMARMA